MEMGEGTSVHWHGMHQVGTQHMDGVSMVTQCPINAHSSFTYRFAASPAGRTTGTRTPVCSAARASSARWWVRQAADPHAGLYDTDQPEHTLLLSDWFHELGATKFAAHHYSNGDNKPKGLIINGRGAFAPSSASDPQTPRYVLSEFRSGLRHRVRVISNAILNCPFVLSVANHSLLVIATDGAPVVPIEVDSLIIYAGERFDFVLTADRPPGNYLLMCGRPGRLRLPLHHGQSAIVSYAGIDETPLQGAGNPAYSDMLAGREASDGHLYTPQINNVALHMPPAPLLYQFDDVLQSHICNNTDFDPSLETEFKACHHGLRLGVNKTVELVLIDKGFTFDASHPFHLHGHYFRVIGME
uniref:Plastocyanin-like domain-containing protein n=1 Tax=Macrostomum lignano TaxID=282301 RepID=A0A1I8F8Y5_9PLAT